MNHTARDAGLKLLRQHALIAGKALPANGGGVAVDDPATGDVIGHVPDLGAAETEQAIAAASEMFRTWSRSDPHARAAFLRADAAAAGGQVLVPAGTYRINGDLTMNEPVRFVGTLRMPRTARLSLRRNFDFPSYADAFGDETEGMKKALQALLDYCDHNILDLCGRKVDLTEPLVIGDLAPGVTAFSSRRVVANGQIAIVPGPAWNSRTVTAAATYDPNDGYRLKNVGQLSAIEVGSRVTGPGVGREVYVTARTCRTGRSRCRTLCSAGRGRATTPSSGGAMRSISRPSRRWTASTS